MRVDSENIGNYDGRAVNAFDGDPTSIPELRILSQGRPRMKAVPEWFIVEPDDSQVREKPKGNSLVGL